MYPQQNDEVQHQTVFQDEECLLSKKENRNCKQKYKGKEASVL